jgi:hypothetical protein
MIFVFITVTLLLEFILLLLALVSVWDYIKNSSWYIMSRPGWTPGGLNPMNGFVERNLVRELVGNRLRCKVCAKKHKNDFILRRRGEVV